MGRYLHRGRGVGGDAIETTPVIILSRRRRQVPCLSGFGMLVYLTYIRDSKAFACPKKTYLVLCHAQNAV